MKWQEFLTLVKTYKNECAAGQIKLDYGTLSTLLYQGALDSMFGGPLSLPEIQAATAELKKALGSQAEPKEAKKTELWGIADIDSDVRLNLWRHQVCPTTTFCLASYFKNALTQLGYAQHPREDIPFRSGEADIWTSWQKVIADPRVYRYYLQRNAPRNPAFVGMVEKVSQFKYKNGEKEALRFDFFTGIDHLPSVVIWAERDGKVHDQLKEAVVPRAYGVAVVRLSEYKGEITASLLKWNTTRC